VVTVAETGKSGSDQLGKAVYQDIVQWQQRSRPLQAISFFDLNNSRICMRTSPAGRIRFESLTEVIQAEVARLQFLRGNIDLDLPVGSLYTVAGPTRPGRSLSDWEPAIALNP